MAIVGEPCNVDAHAKMVDIKDVLKSSISVVQKATAPKSGVEFRQGSIGAIRSSLATSYDASRRCLESWIRNERKKNRKTEKQNFDL